MSITVQARLGVLSGGLLASLATYAQSPERPPYGWHGDWGWGWGHILFGSIMMIVFWGGLILLIVLAGRWMGGGPTHTGPPHKTALDILKERYARGEIDQQEFEERRRHLLE